LIESSQPVFLKPLKKFRKIIDTRVEKEARSNTKTRVREKEVIVFIFPSKAKEANGDIFEESAVGLCFWLSPAVHGRTHSRVH
jgi:hypothetical protein